MKKTLFIILVLLFSFGTLLAQTEYQYTPEELFEEGNFFFLAEEYEEASYYYSELTKLFPENANFAYKAGMTYLNIPGQEFKAIPYLEYAVTSVTTKYKKKDFKEDKAPHYVYFYLGNAYRINNELDKALLTYEEFMDSDEFEGNYNLDIVESEIKVCERAKIIQDVPVEIQRQNLGTPINTPLDDNQAVLSWDGNVMVYITELKFYDGIFLSRKMGTTWSEPLNLNPQVGSDGDLYPTGINEDGTELFFVKRNESDMDLYSSHFDGTFYTKAEPLPKPINSRFNETHASLSRDGKTLYFASDRWGGFGGIDIYSSTRLQDGSWSEPINLGSKINSSNNEDTPFTTTSGDKLFFSSDGHFNMGGYDIFYVYRNEEDGWSNPVNLGYPINTTGDNKFYFPVNEGSQGYYARFLEGGVGEEDIYRITILKTRMFSYEEPTRYRDSFEIFIEDTMTGDTIRIQYNRLKDVLHIDSKSNRFRIIDR